MSVPAGQIFTWEGISLPSYWGGNWGSATADVAFDQIRNTGASSVAIIPSFYMPDKFSNTMGLVQNRSETIAQTRAAMLDVTSRGMNVMLKPHVESLDYTWRAEIAPTDPNLWFQNYKAMMLQYADLAQETGAPMLCIGTELKSMSGPQYRAKWVDLIDSIRAHYSGLITYASTYDEITTVSFWDKVDYIGLDAYLPLSTSNTPTVSQMVDAWTKPHFNSWIRDTLYQGKSAVDYYKALSEQYGKKIIFTEVGYRSMDGTNKDPGVFNSTAAVDQQEQQDCYDALFHVMKNYGGQWLDGSFLWSYHPFEHPEDYGVQVTDYTPENKLANSVITANYSSPAHVTGVTWAGTSNGDKIDAGYNNDTLNGGGGSDTLWGGAGDDQLSGGSGNDTLDGSTGTNTAIFSGTRASYTIASNADGSATITDTRAGQDGSDLLKNVQWVQFSDQTIFLSGATTNDAPTNIALSNASVPENSLGGTVIGTLTAADPNTGDTFTYTILDDPNNKFQIVGNQLKVRSGATLDYETKTSHQVTVRVTDQGGLTYDKVFTIVVGNVNEAPTDIVLSSSSVQENSSGGTAIATLSATDPDANNTFTYSIVNDPDHVFQIVNNQLQVAQGAVLNYEAATSHQITIRVTDQGGLTYDKTLPIAVANVNEAPTDITLSNASVQENSPGGSLIGILSAADPDANSSFTYTLLSDPDSKFQIVNKQLQVRQDAVLDYETKTSHHVTVHVVDQGGLTFDKTFTITVGNANDVPTDIALSNASVLENSAGGTLIGTLTAVDPNTGDTFTYSVLNDPNHVFQISGNQLQVAQGAVLNYEAATSHQVTVRVTDQGGLTYDKVFTIIVGNVGEAPTDITLSNASVQENSPGGTPIGTLGALDPDSNGSFTYSVANDPDNVFQIAGNQLLVRQGAVLDYEAKISHQLTVHVSDQSGLTYDKTFIIAVGNVDENSGNQAPTDLALPNSSVLENSSGGLMIGTFTATDPNIGDTFTYSLVGDPDNVFQVVGDQLQVRDGAILDYEAKTSHQITVRVTDQGGLTYNKAFTINVSDVNEEPNGLTLSHAAVDENSSGGALIGSLSAADPDANGTFTYSIVNDPDHVFQIVNNQLQVRQDAALDYEAATSHQVTIRVTDQAGLIYDKIFSIAVNNVDESSGNLEPDSLTLSNDSVDENSLGGTIVGTLSATDPNSGDSLSFSLLSDPASKFQVVGNQLQVRDGAVLDYETGTSYQVVLRVTDQLGLGYDQAFTIHVTNVAEPLVLRGTPKVDVLTGAEDNDVLYGLGGNDHLFGRAGNDKLYGGLGKDILTGGTGQDIFVFDSKLGKTNAANKKANLDRVMDFSVADDTIHLSKKVFTKIAKKGVLKKDAFYAGTAAHDASDRIIYNKKTGALYYDQDGNGGYEAIQIAILSKKLKVTEKDFFIL